MAVKKVLFHNGNALGDTLMMTCAIRDFKKAYGQEYDCNVQTKCMHVWDNNPHLTAFDKPDLNINLGPKMAVQGSNTNGLHYANGFRMSIEQNLNIRIPQGHIKADLHLTEKEKAERIIEGRYWVLVAGGKKDQFTSKRWPMDRWQQVVEMLPEIPFVLLGESKDEHKPLKGNNIIDLIGQTEHPDYGLRKLFKIFYHADGSAGLLSMHMHLSAAFDKAAVVVAGAREPVSFERYNHHQYLSNQGTLRCNNFCNNCRHFKQEGKKKLCLIHGKEGIPVDYYKSKKLCFEYDPIDPTSIKTTSCWRATIGGCPNQVKGYAKCLMQIQPEDVVRAIRSYYENGALSPIKEKAKVNKETLYIIPSKKPIFKMVTNAHYYGGGERSTVWIMRQMLKKGYDVHLCTTKGVGAEYLKNMPQEVLVTNRITDPCNIFMVYANDMVFNMNKEPYLSVMPNVKADRKIMMCNFKLGAVGKTEWTKHFDLYGFLCSQMRDDLLKVLPGAKCFVLPPPVEIEPFLKETVNYDQPFIHMVRHSSQGDSKHPEDTEQMIKKMVEAHRQTIIFSFMPGPSFLNMNGIHHVYKYHYNAMNVVEFLKRGSCYWYRLPPAYSDQGPRTIIEAMAIGLPVVADNRWGAKDRVTPETGWLCDDAEGYVDFAGQMSYAMLKEKGLAAKQRAREVFDPQNWIKTIVDG